jgi:uncharacterized protein (TIGR03083 family)
VSWLTPERYARELDAETARLAASVTRLAPGAAVPSCPEWTVRDLVTHVGTGHRLATGIIERRRTTRGRYELIPAPDDQGEWTAWLTDGARRLNAAVEARGFAGEAWTWQPKHQTAGFWLRRMVHDLIVHRFDADPSGDLAPDLAADGVDDLLLVFATVMKLPGDGGSLRFAATDTADRWHVALSADGMRWERGDSAADVTCEGPVRDVLLALNRRRGFPAVAGDRALYERFREATRF